MVYYDPTDPNYRRTKPVFSFDEAATRKSFEDQYAPIFAEQRKRLTEDVSTQRATNERLTSTKTEARRLSLKDYIKNARESFANRGLFRSGIRTGAETEATSRADTDINNYLAAQKEAEQALATRESRGLADLDTDFRGRVAKDVETTRSKSISEYEREFDKYNRYLDALKSAQNEREAREEKSYAFDLTEEDATKILEDNDNNPALARQRALASIEANATTMRRKGYDPNRVRQQVINYFTPLVLSQAVEAENRAKEASRSAYNDPRFQIARTLSQIPLIGGLFK